MYLGIIANSNPKSVTEKAKKYSHLILKYAKENNHTILNGGCNGIIEYINTSCEKNNIAFNIYSPALNLDEHKELYNYTLNSCKYIFEKDHEKHLNYRFLSRSLPLVYNSDVVFVFYGMWGTLSELVLATMMGKKIVFLLEDNKHQLKDVYNLISSYNNFNYNETAYFVNTITELDNLLNNQLNI